LLEHVLAARKSGLPREVMRQQPTRDRPLVISRSWPTAVAAGKTSLRGGPLQDYESLPGQIHKLAVVHSDIRNVSPIRENEIINEVE
jgi:hypothetical protein